MKIQDEKDSIFDVLPIALIICFAIGAIFAIAILVAVKYW